MMGFQESFVTMCKLTDEIFLPTIPWIHPWQKSDSAFQLEEQQDFLEDVFPPCDKKCLNDGTPKLEIWKENTLLSTSASWHGHNNSIILFIFYSEQATFIKTFLFFLLIWNTIILKQKGNTLHMSNCIPELIFRISSQRLQNIVTLIQHHSTVLEDVLT